MVQEMTSVKLAHDLEFFITKGGDNANQTSVPGNPLWNGQKVVRLLPLSNYSHDADIFIEHLPTDPPKPSELRAKNPCENQPGFEIEEHAQLQDPDFPLS